MAFDIFLSAASDEFGDLREILAPYLERAGATALIQEKFSPPHTDTLLKLSDLIAPCRAVIHFAGEQSGSCPSNKSIKLLASHLEAAGRPILKDLPELEKALMNPKIISSLTYTQWEAILAYHHDIPLFVYATSKGKMLQESYLNLLELGPIARYASIGGSPEDFVAKVVSDFRYVLRSSPTHLPSNLPPSIGKNFVGRETDLRIIADQFKGCDSKNVAVVQAVSGLGGIGKTRLALEFAHRYASDYSGLFFCLAATPELLCESLADLASAHILNLAEKDADIETRFFAVQTWLKQNPGWLLILNDVDNETAANAVFELTQQKLPGHVLITSRLNEWPTDTYHVDLKVATPAESRSLLIQFSSRNPMNSVSEINAVESLVDRLEGLPIAIELAGTQIAQSGISFSDYLSIFQKNTETALSFRRSTGIDVSDSLASAWLTSIEYLPLDARNVLVELSFFSAAPIPWEMFSDDKENVFHLQRSSLVCINRYAFPSISVHPLILEVAATLISESEVDLYWQKHLRRLITWLPQGGQAPETWPQWEQFKPHAEKWIQQLRELPEEAKILNGLAGYEQYRNAAYHRAEWLKRRALAINEASFGKDHPDVARDLNNLAQLLKATNRLEEAEPLMRRVVEIFELSFGKDHPNVATALNNLAQLLKVTNRLEEAEPLMRRALAIDEASYGKDHPNAATGLNNLAQLLQVTNRLEEAEPLMRRALAIDEASFGKDHPKVAIRLNNLAQLLKSTNRLEETEPLMRRALAIDEASYGKDHPDVATDLSNLAQLLQVTNRLEEAEPLMRRALAIDEASFGKDHPIFAIRLNNLAQLLQATNRLEEAEPLMARVVEIFEIGYGKDHPNVAAALNNLAQLLKATNRLEEAEQLMRRALAIDEASYGKDHPDVAISLNNLADLLRVSGRHAEAAEMAFRVVTLFTQFSETNGHTHPYLEIAKENERKARALLASS